MIDEKAIFVDKNNFGKLTLLKDNLTEKDYKIIYASLKIVKHAIIFPREGGILWKNKKWNYIIYIN